MTFLIIFIFGVVAFLQILILLKKRYWRELIVFSLLHTAAFVLSLLYVLGVQIPSPMLFIKYVIENVLHIKY